MRSLLPSTVPPGRPRGIRRFLTTAGLGAAALVMTLPAVANADVLPSLPQNADGLEQTFSPPTTTTGTAVTPPPPSAVTGGSTPA